MSTYIRPMLCFEQATICSSGSCQGAFFSPIWKWVSMLHSRLACFTKTINFFRTELWKSEKNFLLFHLSQFRKIYGTYSLVPQFDINTNFGPFANIVDFNSSNSSVNIQSSLLSHAVRHPLCYSMKEPPRLTRTWMTCSTIYILTVGTHKTFLMYLLPHILSQNL